MADVLDLQGKLVAMEGIRAEIVSLQLTDSSFNAIGDEKTASGLGYFTISIATGEMTNSSSIEFVINAADIGSTATALQLLDVDGKALLILDLDTPLVVSLAGEATIAVGDLSVTL